MHLQIKFTGQIHQQQLQISIVALVLSARPFFKFPCGLFSLQLSGSIESVVKQHCKRLLQCNFEDDDFTAALQNNRLGTMSVPIIVNQEDSNELIEAKEVAMTDEDKAASIKADIDQQRLVGGALLS